jgi:hypothetical protein
LLIVEVYLKVEAHASVARTILFLEQVNVLFQISQVLKLAPLEIGISQLFLQKRLYS